VIARRLVAGAAIAMLMGGLTGCGSAILMRLDAIALDGPPAGVFPPGSSRQDVEAKLGAPASSLALPDGSRLDTYTYITRNPEWRKGKWALAFGTVITAGFAEAAFVPMAGYEAVKHRREETIVYGADDRVLSYGVPPRYGPPDEGIGAPSFREIRDRCRAEHTDAASRGAAPSTAPAHIVHDYQTCVARRIAIWGVE
jgi:hypothetical protein